MKPAYFTVRAVKKRGFKSAHLKLESRASHAGRNGLHMVPGSTGDRGDFSRLCFDCLEAQAFFFLFFEHILKSYLFYVYQHLT